MLKQRIERSMFYGAPPSVFEKAKMLRKNMTESELLLWQHLSNKKMEGFRFKTQHPIGNYIADFYCHQVKLVVEVDGENHSDAEQKEYDASRSEEMERFNIKVLRFTNGAVKNNIDRVVEEIKNMLNLITHNNSTFETHKQPVK